ncbi:hypothetical protein [Thiothrix fructosivorans]|uniref:hypothetical protein n=1 Tax=Thiothrix fructosivorans TaxID=111770 RepID=UPI001A92B82D|nr:hypothetical protein [Thiothrix fructosivorans]
MSTLCPQPEAEHVLLEAKNRSATTTTAPRLSALYSSCGYRCALCYIRDKEGHEVDFAILQDGVLEELIEVTYSDAGISPSLRYFTERLKPKRATQIVATLDKPYDKDSIRVTNPFRYFADVDYQ